MKPKLIIALLLVACASLTTACHKRVATEKPDPLSRAYDSEPDWNDPQRVIPLNYQQAQGKRVFYQYCVWCHADSTPAGPSNRSNLNPMPPLASDGAVFNSLSDETASQHHCSGGERSGEIRPYAPVGQYA